MLYKTHADKVDNPHFKFNNTANYLGYKHQRSVEETQGAQVNRGRFEKLELI